MRTGWTIHTFLARLQGPFIRIKHAVKYVQLTFSSVTWGNKHYWAMHEERNTRRTLQWNLNLKGQQLGCVPFLFLAHQRRTGQSIYKRPSQERVTAPSSAIPVLVWRILLYLHLPGNPQETSPHPAKFQAISRRKMCYQQKAFGP